MTTPHESSDISSLFNSAFDGSSTNGGVINLTPSSATSDCKVVGCSRNTSIAELLLPKPLLFNNAKVSFDIHLSELKCAIKLCDDCIRCEHALRDEISIGDTPFLLHSMEPVN